MEGIAIALITAFGTVIVAMVGRNNKKTEEINDAVNHKHERGNGETLFDHVLKNGEQMATLKADVQHIREQVGDIKITVDDLRNRTNGNTSRIQVLEDWQDEEARG